MADDPAVSQLESLGTRVGELLDSLESHTDASVGDQVDELLQALDTMHRTALGRLAGLLAHHDLLGHACDDPVLAMVLDIYDLAPDEATSAVSNGSSAGTTAASSSTEQSRLPTAPERPPAAHAHSPAVPAGLIKLDQVMRFPATSTATGALPVPMIPAKPARSTPAATGGPAPRPSPTAGAAPPAMPPVASTPAAPVASTPAAPVAGTPAAPVASTSAAPVASTSGATKPATGSEAAGWTRLFSPDKVAPGTMEASADAKVLIVNIDGVLHALQNRCGGSPLPLHFGDLSGGRVMCPWHKGCSYDVTNGESTTGRRTIVYPVRVDDDAVHVALDQGWATGPLQLHQRAAPL